MARVLKFFVFVALLWGAGLLWFVTLIPSKPAGDTKHADAIVVLTGGGGRLEHGFELLIAGRAPKMFISGVEEGRTLASLLRQKELLPFAGRIPTGSVELGYQARSTVGNAEETAKWVAHEHVKSMLLVTGNYHIPRSVYELRETMPDVVIIPEPVFPSQFANNEWWQFAGSRLVISEYHKCVTSVIVHALLANSW